MKFVSSKAAFALSLVLLGCTGGVEKGQSHPDDITADDGKAPKVTCTAPLADRSRLARLTHRQYQNTLVDLLGETIDVAAVLSPDPTPFRFDNDAELLRVSQPLARDYRRVAEDIGSRIASSPERAEKLAGCTSAESTCGRRFVTEFGLRTVRRPLTPVELEAFQKVFAAGQAAEGFAAAVAWTVEAMLQTPDFLYRVSIDDQPGPDELIAPGPWELASQLSYALWNSMPDEELFKSAADKSLLSRSVLQTQVRRMLSHRRAADVVGDFHSQLMHSKSFYNVQRDPKRFAAFSSTLGPALQREVELFSAAGVLEDELTFEQFMTAPFTFANADVAKLYDVPAPSKGLTSDGFGRVALDASRRGGLLTQMGFLASHGHFDASAPILRGTFILKNILCMGVPPPPGDADLTIPMADPGMTTRELMTRITSPAACKNCHTLINPVGFAFETFDAAGQWRTMDAGKPVDATGTLDLDGEISFDGPQAFVSAVAKSEQAARCYANNWLSFILARQLSDDEQCLADDLGSLTGDKGLTIKELIAEAVMSRSFLYRPNAEQPGAQP